MFQFSIDRGGTFTDIFATVPDAKNPHRVLKLLSEDPKHYDSAPREGIRRILEEVTGVSIPRNAAVPHNLIESIRMGTTVATNALLERKGARMALLLTRGYRDLLHIGNQSRPSIFDLRIDKPDNLAEVVVEVDERVVLLRPGEELPEHGNNLPIVTGTTGERLIVEKVPDMTEISSHLTQLLAAGIRSVAVCFLHSYTYAAHEQMVGKRARSLGFTQVSLSSDVMPMVKIVPRGYTASADAYLTPHIQAYISSFKAGFVDGLEGAATRLSFMQSDGGLSPVGSFSGHKAVLSGPAGGVVGYALTTWNPVSKQPICAFDMGGTSTDVSRYAGVFEHVFETSVAGVTLQAPQLDISTVAAGGGSRLFFKNGLFVVGPESAGAHPGPVCYRKDGGVLAVTDANLVLGRILPEHFPHIFGPGEDEPLDEAGSRAAFARMADDMRAFYGNAEGAKHTEADDIAYGFIKVANEAMCRPIRALTRMKGHDITTHVLACFGGAGPQHACAMARALGISRIFISRYSGILSAYGLSLADVVSEAQAPVALTIIHGSSGHGPVAVGTAKEEKGGIAPPVRASEEPSALGGDALTEALRVACPPSVASAVARDLAARLATLAAEATQQLVAQGLPASSIVVELFVNLRYAGTDSTIMTPVHLGAAQKGQGEVGPPSSSSHAVPAGSLGTSQASVDRIAAAVTHAPANFVAAYHREFGFVLRARDIVADDVRVRGIAQGNRIERTPAPAAPSSQTGKAPPTDLPSASVFFEEGGRQPTPVFRLDGLAFGHAVPGPALIIDRVATVVVEPGFVATLTQYGDLEIAANSSTSSNEEDVEECIEVSSTSSYEDIPADPIQLSVFGHRFMSIAEQMGRVLQRTSVSVNMRERLDYSCALFGPEGGLVANAPHIPVHLGAMQDAVRFQLAYWGNDLRDGDVLVSNHPQLAGGSHLPDITVITPVFSGGSIVFFVASRGHHADVGGIAPGSMPPLSKRLVEEGAAIVAHKLVAGGVFDEAGITALLLEPGQKGIPGCAGSRNLADCLSDLRAQVAANMKGITLVRELIAEQPRGRSGGVRRVHAYMHHIASNAEHSVRALLREFSLSRGLPPVGSVTAIDYMDDGTPIALKVTIDREARSAIFDFTGTGAQVFANTNAPRAVTYSAIIYCLRCLVGSDVPLNQGVLGPVSIIIPEGSLLHPSPEAAVVGGNVLTSQRVVDVVLRAFGACAASQGDMNNLTFGSAEYGYYETICGGAGAGPNWHGRSGVHTHMTNTRITDPEILERRYPVVLRTFSLRPHSGGAGAFRGGDGVVREVQFRKPSVLSILSERRAFQPYGMQGGHPGARGVNTLIRAGGGEVLNLGGKNTVDVAPGDMIRVESPGGGGFGVPHSDGTSGECEDAEYVQALRRAQLQRLPGGLPPPESLATVLKGPTRAAGGNGGAGGDVPMMFTGSVGRYKEVQESV